MRAQISPLSPFSGVAPVLGYRPALDGIRAFAILGVLAAHAFQPRAGGAAIGVYVFFTLSGFLITTLLLEENHLAGRISLARFWGRRVARLFPALLALIAVVTVYALLGTDQGTGQRTLAATPRVLAYVVNWYWAGGNHPGLHGHLWSLAVEEQFYLLWPIALILITRRSKNPAPAIIFIAAMGMLLSPLLRLAIYPGFEGISRIYGTDYVADQLLAGCGLGAILSMMRTSQARTIVTRLGAILLPLSLSALGAIALVLEPAAGESLFLRWFCTLGLSITALASATVIGHVVLSPNGKVARFLSIAPFVWIGERSYSLYLWHILAFTVVETNLGMRGWNAAPVKLLLATVLAMASFTLVERPARTHLRALFGKPQKLLLPCERIRPLQSSITGNGNQPAAPTRHSGRMHHWG